MMKQSSVLRLFKTTFSAHLCASLVAEFSGVVVRWSELGIWFDSDDKAFYTEPGLLSQLIREARKNSIEKIIKSDDTIGNNLNWISKFRRNWQSSSFPIFKKMILNAGINVYPIEDLDLFNRRIEHHLRSSKNKPLLLKATEIINRGNIISDILLNKLVHNS